MNTCKLGLKLSSALGLAVGLFSYTTCDAHGAYGRDYHDGGGYYRGGGGNGYYRGGGGNGYYRGGGGYYRGGGWGGPAVVIGVPFGGVYYAPPAYPISCSIVQECYPDHTCTESEVCG